MIFPFLTNEYSLNIPLHCLQMDFYYIEINWKFFCFIFPEEVQQTIERLLRSKRHLNIDMPGTDRSDSGSSLSCCVTSVIYSDTDLHIVPIHPWQLFIWLLLLWFPLRSCSGILFASRLVLNVPDSLFQLEEAEWALEPFFGVMGVDCEPPSPYLPSQVMNCSIHIQFAWIIHWNHI